MIVNKFKFVWEHNLVSRYVKGEWVSLKQTLCKVYAPGTDNAKFLPIHQAGVVCSTEDSYDIEHGRRLSLTLVLWKFITPPIPPGVVFEENKSQIFTLREWRTQVWETYRTLTKEPRWTPKKKEIKNVQGTSKD